MANTPDGPKWIAWSVARWRDRHWFGKMFDVIELRCAGIH